MLPPSERTGDELTERDASYQGQPSRPVPLSPRERQIIALLLEAYDNKEIADALGMKIRTVKSHFKRLFVKFHITDGIKRVKLAVLLYQAQLDSQTRG